MGRVYDALRRAEKERSERVQADAPPAASYPEPTSPSAPVGADPLPPALQRPDLPRPEGAALEPRPRRRWFRRRSKEPEVAHAADTERLEEGGRKRRRLRRKARRAVEAAEVRDDVLDGRRLRGRRARRAAARQSALASKRSIALREPESFVADQFRTLRGRIDAIASERPLRSIAVTSALPGEGKTTAAINLAVVTAMSVGRRVLLVDCDMRRPSVHHALGLRGEAGLAQVILDRTSLDNAVVKLEGANMDVLPVCAVPPNPSELLASSRMRDLLEELVQRYDRVILDVPPTLGLPDAKTVTELCDGVVLVVRAGETSQDDVEGALDVLDRRRVLGLILNGAHIDGERYEYTRS